MKLQLKNGIILDAKLNGEYTIPNREYDTLPDGFYFTKDNKKVWIEDDKIINILELVGFIIKLLLKLFGKGLV